MSSKGTYIWVGGKPLLFLFSKSVFCVQNFKIWNAFTVQLSLVLMLALNHNKLQVHLFIFWILHIIEVNLLYLFFLYKKGTLLPLSDYIRGFWWHSCTREITNTSTVYVFMQPHEHNPVFIKNEYNWLKNTFLKSPTFCLVQFKRIT